MCVLLLSLLVHKPTHGEERATQEAAAAGCALCITHSQCHQRTHNGHCCARACRKSTNQPNLFRSLSLSLSLAFALQLCQKNQLFSLSTFSCPNPNQNNIQLVLTILNSSLTTTTCESIRFFPPSKQTLSLILLKTRLLLLF